MPVPKTYLWPACFYACPNAPAPPTPNLLKSDHPQVFCSHFLPEAFRGTPDGRALPTFWSPVAVSCVPSLGLNCEWPLLCIFPQQPDWGSKEPLNPLTAGPYQNQSSLRASLSSCGEPGLEESRKCFHFPHQSLVASFEGSRNLVWSSSLRAPDLLIPQARSTSQPLATRAEHFWWDPWELDPISYSRQALCGKPGISHTSSHPSLPPPQLMGYRKGVHPFPLFSSPCWVSLMANIAQTKGSGVIQVPNKASGGGEGGGRGWCGGEWSYFKFGDP